MARGDQLGRQWKIIQTLIASPRGKTAAQLADDLDYHWRTVYRDLEALQAAGFPLYTEKAGRQNRWCLLDSARKSIPIPLIPAELMALFFSRDMLKTRLKGTVFYDSLESLLQKIKTTLAPDFAGNLERIEKSLHVAPQPFKPHERFREILDRVNTAILERRHVDITYYTMSRTEVTRRRLAPYRIWFFDGTFYIIGHCRLRDGVRIFALDRIKDLHPSEEPFEMPADFDAEAFMKDSFGVYQGKPVRVRSRVAVGSFVGEIVSHAGSAGADPRPE